MPAVPMQLPEEAPPLLACSFVLLMREIYWLPEEKCPGHLSESSLTRKRKKEEEAFTLQSDLVDYFPRQRNLLRPGSCFYWKLKSTSPFYFNLQKGWMLFSFPMLPLGFPPTSGSVWGCVQPRPFSFFGLQFHVHPRSESFRVSRAECVLTPDVTSSSRTPFIWMIDLWN